MNEPISANSNAEEQKGGCLRSFLLALLVVVAIFLVVLAFLFAACSQAMKGI